MSSDDDGYGLGVQQGSGNSIPPQSAGGAELESPTLQNIKEEADRRDSVNGHVHTNASEIANTDEKVKAVLFSDIGLSVLLNRIKQDVATCKELASLLKKRAVIEDEHGRGLQKLAKATQDILKRQDMKQQYNHLAGYLRYRGFNRQLFQATRAWDESTACGVNFATQLIAMADEITELAKVIDKRRKALKHDAVRDETNVTQAEQIAEKARLKHESLGADLEKAISASRGESFPPSKGRFGMARKSGAQLIKHEDDLRGKRLEADKELYGKQQVAYELRRELMNTLRPRNVKSLLDLISETESALSFHLQKFALLTETLAANQGNAIAPMNGSRLGFSALVEQINDGNDFREYVLEYSGKVPPTNRYSNPPALSAQAVSTEFQTTPNAGYGKPTAPQLPDIDPYVNRGDMGQGVQRGGAISNGSPPQSFIPPVSFQTSQPQVSMHARGSSISSQLQVLSSSSQPQGPFSSPTQQQITYPSHSPPPDNPPPTVAPPAVAQPFASQSSLVYPQVQPPASYTSQNISPTHPSSLRPASPSAVIPTSYFSTQTPPVERTSPPPQITHPGTSGQPYSSVIPSKAFGDKSPPKPSTPEGQTFGVPIEEVISREKSTLPLIVAQCVIAINQFGIDTEGIYRVSGSVSTLAKLKRLFDFQPDHVDFRTTAGFFGDINAVAGILKQYLRELPEPLLTRVFYNDFIQAASIEPHFHRRDAVHALVNDLPDANYSCIRTLALHLHKIAEHSERNRMTTSNLAAIFGPTLLASEGTGMEDNTAQIRVAETIITYALDMFELEEES